MVPAPLIELVVDCKVTRFVPPAVTAEPIDSAPVAVRVTLPLLVLTAPVVVMPPVLLTVTVPGLAVLVMPVTVSGAAVLVRLMLPLVVLVPLKLPTVLALVSVVPPTDEVVSRPEVLKVPVPEMVPTDVAVMAPDPVLTAAFT